MNFSPITTIKGEALAEFTYVNTTEVAGTADIVEAAKVVEAQGEKNSALTRGDAK